MTARGSETIARGSETIARGSEMIARGSEMIARGSEMIARGSEMIARGSETIARGSEMIARGSEMIARGSEMIARDSEMIARGSETIARRSEIIARNPHAIVRLPQIFRLNHDTSRSRGKRHETAGGSGNYFQEVSCGFPRECRGCKGRSLDSGAVSQTRLAGQIATHGGAHRSSAHHPAVFPATIQKARAEFDQKRGPNFAYRPLIGEREPPLNYRGSADP